MHVVSGHIFEYTLSLLPCVGWGKAKSGADLGSTPLSRVWVFEGVKPRASELLLAGLGYLDGLGNGEWLVCVVTWVAEGDLAVTGLVGGLDYPARLLDVLAV
ncbi:MAG: hypothetical protein RI919_862 [Actinomycetota bacterium]